MMICGNFSRLTNTMSMISKRRALLLIAACAAVAASLIPSTESAGPYPLSHKHGYELALYRVSSGWGYDISFNGRTIIHQPFVPALSGDAPFPDRASAFEAASLVIGKITSGEGPSLKKEEVEEILQRGKKDARRAR